MQVMEPREASGLEDARYRELVETVADCAVCTLDETGAVTSWNAGAERFHGYTRSEIVGRCYSHLFVPEDRQNQVPERALAIAAKTGRFESEGWRAHKDGGRFWSHVIIDPIRNDAGALTGFAQVTRDLTERRAAEAALRRSEEQFRLLVQSVTDYAIFMLDPDGNVVSWNPGAQRIKGYEPGEIIGSHFSRFYMEEDRKRGLPQTGLKTATAEGRFENEGWRLRKDGSRFWASVVIDAIRDERGSLLGFAKITRDITEKLAAQRALDETREALFQAQKLEAIGQLTGGVAHDFNNLLMVILSSLSLMRKRLPADPKLVNLLDNADQAAQRGTALIQRMLAFARRQELDRKPIDLPALVRGMSDLLQRSIGPAMQIEPRFPPALPKVKTDANQLEAALLNLAVNARDAMPDGGAFVLSARDEIVGASHPTGLRPGHYVCFSVTDSGEGMDEATLARATDPFFSTKGVGKGTGLGLSMVHGFAEQSGGRLTLRSERNVGTTVEVWLPVAEEDENALPNEARDSHAVPSAREERRLQVLAVDDDALVLMNTAAMLEDLGCIVVEAISGEEALKSLQRNPDIDLVITDQAMPRMTGAQLSEAIKRERPGLPIVLATGYADLPECVCSDMPRLPKPFGQEQLAQVVRSAVCAPPREESDPAAPE
ncbi:MAG: PAS domain S-box protein [Pararhizobium sp.]